MAKATKKAPAVVRALRCYFPKRDSSGAIRTETRVLCPPHYVAIFSFERAAYGCGEFFPIESCEACKKGA